VRAAGKHAAPVPLAETIVGGWLLAQAGLEVPLGRSRWRRCRRRAADAGARGGSWRVSGTVSGVPWGAAAGHVVVAGDATARRWWRWSNRAPVA